MTTYADEGERTSVEAGPEALDPFKLEEFVGRFAGDLGAVLHAATVLIGDQLGLYRAMADGRWLTPRGTWMIVEPFAHERLEDNLNVVGRIFYSGSTTICLPVPRSQEVDAGLGAQAGEARLREVVTAGGFRHFRRVGRDAVQPRLRGSTVSGTLPRSTRGDQPRDEGGATMDEMTIDVLGCLEEAESRLRALTSGLAEADLDRPTPCTEWDVRALVSHTIGAMEMYAAFADGGPAPDFESMMSGRDLLGGEPHGAVLASCTRSQRAWSQPGVLQRELTTPWGPMSGERVAAQSTFSTLVHGWDLAVSLGEDAELPQHLLALSWSFAEDLVPVLREVGVVAPPVEVGEGATATQRLLAFLGRDPGGTVRPTTG